MPSGTVTFLFTDIEDSSRLWDQHPLQMREALERHDGLLAAAIAANGGYVFTTAGDSFAAAFQTADAAASAAVEIQARIGAGGWNDDTPVRVRIGLHTGEAHERGGDYFGPAVNRAARVEAAGHGGQILTSGVTARVLGQSTSAVWELVDLGEHRLKGLSQSEHLHQLGPGSFDEVRADSAATGAVNVPVPRTSFVGRTSELDAVAAALGVARLVTVVGIGGMGKTRLAIEVAGQTARSDSMTSAWFVELGDVTDPAAVPDAVAATVGIDVQAGRSVTDQVIDVLDETHSLVVLDNCEHLIDAAAGLVEELLERTAGPRVLCTSREALRLDGETVISLGPLRRDGDDASADAVQLFIERAQAVAPSADLTDRERIAELCERLDSMALAIELAAARMQSMSVEEVLGRLDDRFRLLGGTRRGVERHRTLRRALEWSFDLLDEREERVLTACSLFVGGLEIDGAAAVNPDLDEFDVLDTLDSLVGKSLLVATHAPRGTRYAWLETVREFAQERLERSDRIREVGLLQARFLATASRHNQDIWASPLQPSTYRWFADELPNLRTAFNWCVAVGELELATDIAIGSHMIGNWSYVREPLRWIDELLLLDGIESQPAFLELLVCGCRASEAGGPRLGLERAKRALALSEGLVLDEVPPTGHARAFLAISYFLGGSEPEREAWAAEIVASADPMLLPAIVRNAALQGRSDRARDLAEVAIARAREAGHPWVLAFSLIGAAHAYADSDPVRAIGHATDALDTARSSLNLMMELNALEALAEIHREIDEPLSLRCHQQAAEGYRASGSSDHLHRIAANVAAHLANVGEYEAAAEIFGTTDDREHSLFCRDALEQLEAALGGSALEQRLGESASLSPARAYALLAGAIDARLASL